MSATSPRILVVEDNPDNMKLMAWALEDAGYEFEGVGTAEEGLKALDRHDFDIVLMDISLPGMDGKEATRRIRAEPRFVGLPVVAVTAHAVTGEREAILQSGVTALVTKPIDEDQLLAVIRDCLAVEVARERAKILVVDDVLDNVKLLSYELSDHGYEVVTALDGPTALTLARLALPDVILLDVMMPGMDGIEVCRRLKIDSGLKHIPVVMVSALEEEDDVVDGLNAGAHDYVTKPFNPRILLARVRSAARAKADHDLIADLNRRLAEQASIDALTGARNRYYLHDAMIQAISLSRRRELPLSLVMLDVDEFKAFNDAFGHTAGDEVLRVVVDLMTQVLRAHDVVARYGGEEFVVLLPATDYESSRIVAERLRSALVEFDRPRRPITASMGVATTDSGDAEPLTLLNRADQALYLAKGAGRNRVIHERELLFPDEASESLRAADRWHDGG